MEISMPRNCEYPIVVKCNSTRLNNIYRWLIKINNHNPESKDDIVVVANNNKCLLAVYITTDYKVISISLSDYANVTSNTESNNTAIIGCRIIDFIQAIEYIRNVSGQYFIRVTKSTLSIFGNGKQGVSIPKATAFELNTTEK